MVNPEVIRIWAQLEPTERERRARDNFPGACLNLKTNHTLLGAAIYIFERGNVLNYKAWIDNIIPSSLQKFR